MKWLKCILFIFLIVSCSTYRRVVPVAGTSESTSVSVSKDSIFFRDSIFIRDSIFLKEKGDTVYRYELKTEYKYRIINDHKIQKDTLIVRDSIPYAVPVVEYKEIYKQTLLEKMLMYIGILSLAALVAIFGIKYLKLYLKK